MRRRTPTALIAVGSALLGGATPAWSLNYCLSSDLGVHGLYHLCKYSNGKIYSFNATQLCPLQVTDDGPAQYSNGNMVGFKAGEYQDGMTKVCVYKVSGSLESIRIGAMETCPLTYNF